MDAIVKSRLHNSKLRPINHVGRRWLYINMVSKGKKRFVAKVFSTDAACHYLYACNICGTNVNVSDLLSDDFRLLQSIVMGPAVRIELIAQAIEHFKIDTDLLWTMKWPLTQRSQVAEMVGISLTMIEMQEWQQAQELVLYTLLMRTPIASKCVEGEEARRHGQAS